MDSTDAPPPFSVQNAAPSALTTAERRVVGLLALVQFVNVLDFMMVMPLGPDFSRELDIPTSNLGIIGGSYTAAASVSGLVSAFVLDRFPRKKALMTVVTGLALATIAGAFARGLGSLLAARVVAGAFGGPATALALAIVADSVPVQKRGRALGVVMGAFSIASIFGVPAGLELARLGSWRTPFVAVGLLTLATVFGARIFMSEPPAGARHAPFTVSKLLSHFRETDYVLSLALGACVMFASFVMVPNIATFVQKNLGFPREKIGLMYLCGGLASLLAMQLAGRATDRFGATNVGLLGSAAALVPLYFGFANHNPLFHPVVISVLFMGATSVRAIAFNTVTSRVPSPSERGSFMSLQSTIQHFASACGAFASSKLLSSNADGKLVGIEKVAAISMALTLLVPVLIAVLERRVDRRKLEAVGDTAQA